MNTQQSIALGPMSTKLLFLAGLTVSTSCCAAGVDIESLQARAAQGDSEAALDLFHLFLTEKNDPTEAAFWLRIGAEQENCAAVIEYGRLLEGGKQDNASRDIWFDKARKLGCDLSRLKSSSSSAKDITSNSVNGYVSRSIKGDASASYKISHYFSSEETYDFLNYYFYLRLGAQQGSCDGLREFRKLQKDSNLRAEFKVSADTMSSIPACTPETRD